MFQFGFLQNEPALVGPFTKASNLELAQMLMDAQACSQGIETSFIKDIKVEQVNRTCAKAKEEFADSIAIQLSHTLTPKETQVSPSKPSAYLVFQDSKNGARIIGLFNWEEKAMAACRKKTHYYICTPVNAMVSSKVEKIFPRIKTRVKTKSK